MSTSKKEILRQHQQAETLQALGFTEAEAEQLRRISMTLQRWHELECGTDGGCIERDEKTGKPYFVSAWSGRRVYGGIPDRETGARKRLAGILEARNERCETGSGTRYTANFLTAYIQTDPRGAALYIIRPGDVPEGADVSAYYSRGICVY